MHSRRFLEPRPQPWVQELLSPTSIGHQADSLWRLGTKEDVHLEEGGPKGHRVEGLGLGKTASVSFGDIWGLGSMLRQTVEAWRGPELFHSLLGKPPSTPPSPRLRKSSRMPEAPSQLQALAGWGIRKVMRIQT